MGIIIRQSLKASFAGYLGTIIGAFNILWLSPKFLTPSQIGLISWIESVGLLVLVLCNWGGANLSDKFFPMFKNAEKKHNGLLLFLFIYSYTCLLFFGLLFYSTQNIWLSYYTENAPENQAYFGYVWLYVIFLLQIMLLESYLRGHLRIALPSFFREVILRILIVISILFYASKYFSFDFLVLIRVFSYGLIGIILWFYIKYLKILYLTFQPKFFTKNKLKEIFTYSTYIMFAGAGSIVVMKIDTIMIPAMLNNSALGIYMIAYFLGSVLDIPRKAIAQISTPIISQAWKENNITLIQKIYQKSALNQLIIACFLFLGIWLNIDNIFMIMPNGKLYLEGKWVVFFIALTRVVDMATGISTEILIQSKYFRFNFWSIIILSILMIFGNTIFIPMYQITGAAFATFLSFALYNLIKFIFLYIKFGFQPFHINSLKVLILSLFIYYTSLFLPIFSSIFLNIFIVSTYITLVYVLVVWFGNFSEDITQIVENILNKCKKIFKNK
ncbi:MAG: hypothetical protein EAZ85_06485 [Bacteroidetes bacterium]|nr:MAG: hypothetical protein EAZ85_06485 [Bacteroidota bacterium]TAG90478.1 MAG: hypothetical protein EAZ20_04165 [Bacteroidota bacterium]